MAASSPATAPRTSAASSSLVVTFLEFLNLSSE